MEKQKKYSLVAKVILAGVFLSVLSLAIQTWQSFGGFPLASAKGLGRLMGTTLPTVFGASGLSFLFGIIPYFNYRKRVKNPIILVFGTLFIIFAIIMLYGLISLNSET